MNKQFLYIVDPLPSLNAKADSTLAIMQEACARGIKAFMCEIEDIFINDGKLCFMAAPVELQANYYMPPAYLSAKKRCSSDDFQAIFMRKDPPVDGAYVAALLMLRCYDEKKTLMINDPSGILLANEKLFGQKVAADFFPPSLVSFDKQVLKDFASAHERMVIKPLFKAGGAGVLVLEKDDRNLGSALELLTDGFSLPVMAQAYIKDARAGDKRVIVLGGDAVGAVLRMPSEHDHRANFHAGGSAQASSLTDRDREIARALRPHLLDLGLHFVGIDIIGGYLTEINVTSPTCLIEIERLSQKKGEKPLRAQVVDYIERLIA